MHYKLLGCNLPAIDSFIHADFPQSGGMMDKSLSNTSRIVPSDIDNYNHSLKYLAKTELTAKEGVEKAVLSISVCIT